MLKFTALSFVIGASALRVPRSSCSFEITASGAVSGTIGQLPDGQVRIGGGLPASSFSIALGGITDAAGRGCILTPDIEQFQCDQGARPTQGFALDTNGAVLSSGDSTFFACPASDSEWNVYTIPVIGQSKCVEVTLTASECFVPAAPSNPAPTTVTVTVTECPSPSAPLVIGTSTTIIPQPSASVSTEPSIFPQPSATTTAIPQPPASSAETTTTIIIPQPPSSSQPPSIHLSTGTAPQGIAGTAPPHFPTIKPSAPLWHNTTRAQPTTTKPTTTVALPPDTCPTTLVGSPDSGNWQFPHLIVPVSSSSPDTAAGTSFFGTVSSNTSSIFNFDIPASYAGKTCSLIFLLPQHADLETSSYTLSGSGAVDFEKLSSVATQGTTFGNAPSVSNDLGAFALTPGSSTVVSTFACPAGSAVAYEAKAVGDTDLYFFQDFNPSPLGLYITTC